MNRGKVTSDPAMPELPELLNLPRDEDGPVFAEPWQAHAFAMVHELVGAGVFSWSQWAAVLGQQFKQAEAAGNPDDGSNYYQHWVAALEGLLNEREITDALQLTQRKEDWAAAYRRTPHGKPVLLVTSE